MNTKHFPYILSLMMLSILSMHWVAAEGHSFFDALLRFTGISSTPSTQKGTSSMKAGDIWLVQTGETGTDAIRRITKDGNYRTPLWHPGGQSILAMKDRNKLVQLNTQGSKEVQLHAFATKNTVLIGFDRSNPDRVLVQQEPLVGVLSLANGKITPLPYDPKNAKDREALDQLNSDTRYYGNIIVSIVDQAVVDLKGRAQTIYTIKIDNNVNDIAIKCPSVCSQPALSSDGRQLLFIDH